MNFVKGLLSDFVSQAGGFRFMMSIGVMGYFGMRGISQVRRLGHCGFLDSDPTSSRCYLHGGLARKVSSLVLVGKVNAGFWGLDVYFIILYLTLCWFL